MQQCADRLMRGQFWTATSQADAEDTRRCAEGSLRRTRVRRRAPLLLRYPTQRIPGRFNSRTWEIALGILARRARDCCEEVPVIPPEAGKHARTHQRRRMGQIQRAGRVPERSQGRRFAGVEDLRLQHFSRIPQAGFYDGCSRVLPSGSACHSRYSPQEFRSLPEGPT